MIEIDEKPIQRGQIIPDFTLENTRGETISSRSYYMRRNYVIVLLPNVLDAQWESWLAGLERAIETIPERDVICLIVAPDKSVASGAGLSNHHDCIQLLVDFDGKACQKFSHSRAEGYLLITDQYGVVFHAVSGSPTCPGMDPTDIPNWVELIACRCS